MDWSFIFSCVSVPTSIYGIYELIKKGCLKINNLKAKSIIWKNNIDWVIIVPRYKESYRRVEDIVASEKIYMYCKKLGLNCIIQDDAQPIPNDKNLILVCGPKANSATKKLYRFFKVQFETNSDTAVFHDTLSNVSYTSQNNEQTGELEKDYGILSRYIDSNSKRIYIFCAGLHGFGTLGAATMLTDYKLAKYIKKYDSFESVILSTPIDQYFSIGPIEFIIPPRKLV